MVDYQALAAQFNERGLLILDSFFDAAKIDEIQGELHGYLRLGVPQQTPGRIVYEQGPGQKIRNIFDMHEDSEYFATLAQAPQLVELSRAIFVDQPLLMSVELFGKPAGVGSEVPHHQDNAYFNLIPDHALTIWVALADATEENGCVRYIEGSHTLGTLPHRASGVKGNSMRLAELPPDVGSEVPGVVRRGGALVHHCNTIHRSEPNRSSQDRPGLLFVYKSVRCRADEAATARYNAAQTVTAVDGVRECLDTAQHPDAAGRG